MLGDKLNDQKNELSKNKKIREKERSTSSQKAIEHLKSSLIFLGTAIKLEEEMEIIIVL